jgi:pheromone shutdown protein TraB
VMATGVGGDYIAQYVDAYAREMQAGGASAAEVAAMRADMASFQEAYQNPLFRMLITLSEIAPVGLLVALVTALILRNPRVLPAQRA